MEELTIDLTYGTALFEAARETGKTDLINEEAGQLIELFGQEPDLHKFVNTPGISAEEKKNVLENVFRGRICDELLNFLFTASKNAIVFKAFIFVPQALC